MKNRKLFTINGRRFSFEVIPHNNQGRPPSYWVRDAAGNDIGHLHRQHLKHLAWDKYTFALSLDFEISATKLPYCATSLRMMNGTLPDKGSVIPVPDGFLEKHALIAQARTNGTAFMPDVQDADKDRTTRWEDMKNKTKPRKIPHVRMVRAAALKPGMVVVLGYKNGRVDAEVEVRSVDPVASFVSIKCLHMQRQRADGMPSVWDCKLTSIIWHADQVLPVFIEWRDTVAL